MKERPYPFYGGTQLVSVPTGADPALGDYERVRRAPRAPRAPGKPRSRRAVVSALRPAAVRRAAQSERGPEPEPEPDAAQLEQWLQQFDAEEGAFRSLALYVETTLQRAELLPQPHAARSEAALRCLRKLADAGGRLGGVLARLADELDASAFDGGGQAQHPSPTRTQQRREPYFRRAADLERQLALEREAARAAQAQARGVGELLRRTGTLRLLAGAWPAGPVPAPAPDDGAALADVAATLRTAVCELPTLAERREALVQLVEDDADPALLLRLLRRLDADDRALFVARALSPAERDELSRGRAAELARQERAKLEAALADELVRCVQAAFQNRLPPVRHRDLQPRTLATLRTVMSMVHGRASFTRQMMVVLGLEYGEGDEEEEGEEEDSGAAEDLESAQERAVRLVERTRRTIAAKLARKEQRALVGLQQLARQLRETRQRLDDANEHRRAEVQRRRDSEVNLLEKRDLVMSDLDRLVAEQAAELALLRERNARLEARLDDALSGLGAAPAAAGGPSPPGTPRSRRATPVPQPAAAEFDKAADVCAAIARMLQAKMLSDVLGRGRQALVPFVRAFLGSAKAMDAFMGAVRRLSRENTRVRVFRHLLGRAGGPSAAHDVRAHAAQFLLRALDRVFLVQRGDGLRAALRRCQQVAAQLGDGRELADASARTCLVGEAQAEQLVDDLLPPDADAVELPRGPVTIDALLEAVLHAWMSWKEQVLREAALAVGDLPELDCRDFVVVAQRFLPTVSDVAATRVFSAGVGVGVRARVAGFQAVELLVGMRGDGLESLDGQDGGWEGLEPVSLAAATPAAQVPPGSPMRRARTMTF